MHTFPDPERSGPQLHAWRTGQWLVEGDLAGPLVVLVHGLGSNSVPLNELAQYVARTYPVAVFNYAAHKGIASASDHLSQRLQRFAPALKRYRFAVIGHSMGGLVAKHFARHAAESLRVNLAGIATLGTPHSAVLPGGPILAKQQWLAILLSLFERDDFVDPYSTSMKSLAVQQLLGIDGDALLFKLLHADKSSPLLMPLLSVSGGHSDVELAASWSVSANQLLQANMERPNDGLIEEKSACLVSLLESAPVNCRHSNSYLEWKSTNHAHLLTNQGVAEVLVDWLAQYAFS
jgi:pimeloyl-ACP methyl ester carboxylesterase